MRISMVETFLAPDNIPFAVALVLMIGIAILEGITTIIGFGFSQFLESLLPEVDLPEADIELHTQSVFTKTLGWIKVKDVPMLVVLILFLTFFSLSGFTIQVLLKNTFGSLLPWYLAIIPALIITLPLVRQLSGLLAKFVIRDKTEVVSTDTFIGKTAIITLGNAKIGFPAEAKLEDEYGQLHYIRVEPDEEGVELEQNTEILLVNKRGYVFTAIKSPDFTRD